MLVHEQYDTQTAAGYLGYQSADTLRNGRHTGKLAGVTAPRYRKIGNRVFYERAALDEWLAQFKERTCTTDTTEIEGHRCKPTAKPQCDLLELVEPHIDAINALVADVGGRERLIEILKNGGTSE